MKHLHFIIILLGGLVMAGCQDQLAVRDAVQQDELGTKAGVFTVQTNNRYVFPAEKNFEAWGNIIGLENRFAACEVPENLLRAMTTDALVRTALNYPLNFIYSAYNDPFVAVDLIIKNSALHRELVVREDAATVLLDYYARTTIDKTDTYSVSNRSDSCLRYSNEMFLDYMMASGKIPGLNDGENGKRLQEITNRKLAERLADSETFSEVSVAPLLLITGTSPEGLRSTYSTTWCTPFGRPLTVTVRDEMTWNEVYQVTQDYTTNYPNATLLAMASNTYNGNCYAWIKQDLSMLGFTSSPAYTSWLVDAFYPGVPQMRTLWGGINNLDPDAYESCSSTAAERVYYGQSVDHSAVPYTTGNYKSKWGIGPLMGHAPAYCPYSVADTTFYQIRTTPINGYGSIVGDGTINPDTNYIYTYSALHARGIQWSARPYGNESLSFSFDANTHTLNCHDPGAYLVCVDGYYDSTHHLFHKELIVVCYPH